jgi:hypothetical protein
MNQTSGRPTPERGRHLWDEPDIGSGEKSPGQKETEEIIKQIPPLPEQQRRERPGPGRQGDAGAPASQSRRAGSASRP